MDLKFQGMSMVEYRAAFRILSELGVGGVGGQSSHLHIPGGGGGGEGGEGVRPTSKVYHNPGGSVGAPPGI